MVQRCFKGVLRNFEGSRFMKVWRVLQGRLKSALKVYEEYFIEVERVFQGSFKGGSVKF